MTLVLDAMDAPKPLRVAARVLGWPFKWLGLRGDPTMPPAPRALSALGPAYIKFGQVLSTRPDVVGVELARQLRVLQDELPPFSRDEARREIERELGQPMAELFSEFSEPIAAASIAQVHAARIAGTGEKVAVKVLRPGIERAFQKDVDAFYLIARLVELLSPSSRRLRPMEVITHFEGVVQGELDLRLESGRRRGILHHHGRGRVFSGATGLLGFFRAPGYDSGMGWRHSRHDLDALDAAGVDRKAVSERVLQFFLNHALRDGYFHADMHQGNLKITPEGEIVAMDFGIMGRIDEYTRRVYAEILFGFIQRDYRRVAEVHFEAGYVPQDQDIDEFARALRVVGEPIFGMDASRISMARLLTYLFEVTERFGMQTRTELILLQRTMVVVEGVARSLNPHINIWQAAHPVVETYIARNIGAQALVRDLAKTSRVLMRLGPKLPALAETLLQPPVPPMPTTHRSPAWMALLWFITGAGVALASVWFGLHMAA